MKKTSIFFLIVSVVLIITGFILRNNAIKAAEEQNVQLFQQTLTENGDLVETVGYSSEDTNRINITISDGTIISPPCDIALNATPCGFPDATFDIA